MCAAYIQHLYLLYFKLSKTLEKYKLFVLHVKVRTLSRTEKYVEK